MAISEYDLKELKKRVGESKDELQSRPKILEDWQMRVIAECNELGVKLDAIRAFNSGPIFKKLSHRRQGLLLEQMHHMANYYAVLNVRIEDFKNE